MGYRVRALGAVRWTAASALGRGTLQVAQVSILARLLRPEDFGVAASAMAIIAVVSFLGDLGLTSAYLQDRNVSESERSALFWANVLFGVVLSAVLLLGSHAAIACGYDTNVGNLLILYSPTFAITALGQQLRFDAQKRLELRAASICEVLSTLLGSLMGISAAALGAGPSAIVVTLITTASVNTMLAWLCLRNGWLPLTPVRLAGSRRFLRFGFKIIANSLVNKVATGLDLLLGSHLLSVREFGLYAGPRDFYLKVLMLVNPVVTRVAFPLVSELAVDRERVTRLYLRMTSAVVGVGAPIYMLGLFFPEVVISVIFGPGWAAAEGIVCSLSAWALSRSIMNPVGSLLFGMGRPGLALKWNLVQLTLTATVLTLMGRMSGDELAVAMLSLSLLQILPGWYFLARPLCGVRLRPYAVALLSPLLTCITGAVITRVAMHSHEPSVATLAAVGMSVCLLHGGLAVASGQQWILTLLGQCRRGAKLM